jgi:hypothetical protein
MKNYRFFKEDDDPEVTETFLKIVKSSRNDVSRWVYHLRELMVSAIEKQDIDIVEDIKKILSDLSKIENALSNKDILELEKNFVVSVESDLQAKVQEDDDIGVTNTFITYVNNLRAELKRMISVYRKLVDDAILVGDIDIVDYCEDILDNLYNLEFEINDSEILTLSDLKKGNG